ncbi:hypothetical protein JAAARDRAFT_113539, partial [Jaapia argillacea MUCL 33604]
LWLHSTKQKFVSVNPGRERCPELSIIFRRFSVLASLPVKVIVAYSGGNRALVKRGKRVNGKMHHLTPDTYIMSIAFGFIPVKAPADAEAYLAWLNRIHVINAVMTDDFDAVVYGAPVVIRNPNWKDKQDAVQVVTAERLLTEKELTKGGLMLIAVLVGGDYHLAGLPECGVKIAVGLAQCGFGDSLLKVIHDTASKDLDSAVACWRQALQEELRTNAHRRLPHRCPALAESIPDSFPNLSIVRAYTHPLSPHSEQVEHNRDWSVLHLASMDVPSLASLCERFFRWGTAESLPKKFAEYIWPGFCLRHLCQ